jgi:signal transduction histidine kinase
MQRLHSLQVAMRAPNRSSRLTDDAAAFLFTAVRELLLNVVKHAGVRNCLLKIDEEADRLLFEVEDGGAGFDAESALAGNAESAGLGLYSVRERLQALEGEMQIASQPGRGTQVRLVAPLASVAEVMRDHQASTAAADTPGESKARNRRVELVEQ